MNFIWSRYIKQKRTDYVDLQFAKKNSTFAEKKRATSHITLNISYVLKCTLCKMYTQYLRKTLQQLFSYYATPIGNRAISVAFVNLYSPY